MEPSTSVAVPIPAGVRVNRVGIKRQAFEKRYGIEYQVDTSALHVLLTGPGQLVEQARAELESLLQAMTDSGAPTQAPKADTRARTDRQPFQRSNQSPSVASTRAQDRPTRPSGYVNIRTTRSFSICNGSSFTWQFQPASRPDIDVDINKYPFELVRKAPTASSLAQETSSSTQAFVHNFDEAYLAAISAPYARYTAKDNIRVKALLGRQLYNFTNPRNVRHELSWSELQRLQKGLDVASAWSNICDPENPLIKALIAKLHAEIEAQGVKQKEEMTVMLKRPGESVDASYVQLNNRALHNITLSDGVSARVRCYTKEPPAGPQWRDPVLIHEAADGNFWNTQVSFKRSMPRDCYIPYMSMTKRSTVMYQGLRCQLIQIRDEYDIKVSIPTREALSTPPDKAHTKLVSELIALLDGVA